MKISFESEAEMELLISKSEVLIHKIVSSFHDDWDTDNGIEAVKTQTNMGDYGRSDIIIFYKYEDKRRCIVVELKNCKVKTDDLGQLARYMAYIKKCSSISGDEPWVLTGGMLIGTGSAGDFPFLYNISGDDILWSNIEYTIDSGVSIHVRDKDWSVYGAKYSESLISDGISNEA